MKPRYITDRFPKFLEKHSFKHMPFHDLRHCSASLLLANGVQMKQIQEWLGHSDFQKIQKPVTIAITGFVGG